MNVELDKLLCLLDGKITAYRMKVDITQHKSITNEYMQLVRIQLEIQKMWDENINNKEA